MPTAQAQPTLPQIAPRSPAAAPSRLPMHPFGPVAAKPSADWDADHSGGPHRRHSPKPGFPRRSEASRSSTIVAVAPDPTEPKPCSRLLICLQINQQTIAGKVAARKAALAAGLPCQSRVRGSARRRQILHRYLGAVRAADIRRQPDGWLGVATAAQFAASCVQKCADR